MRLILIPGLWLDASSWDAVVPTLAERGHRVEALTMPGVGAAESAEIGMADWVDAVTRQIDADDAVLVAHSGGGNVAWGAVDARADRVHRVIFVDTIPPSPGSIINEFEVVDGVIPFPGWDSFEHEDIYDLDDALRARIEAGALSVPASVPTDPVMLTNSARHRVPVTLLMGATDDAAFRAAVAEWGPHGDEFRAIEHARVERIGSGHWPQYSRPERLADLILRAL